MYAPTYPQAMLFPVFAFPAWTLCLPSMIWHFRQANVAAGSAILWIILHNFFNSINALIWPRDNLTEWWDGSIWCDIHVRLQVGSYVGLAASAAIITRKLAKVMDTRNITVSISRGSKIREKVWELVWCWGAPLLLIIVYYVVQPARYMIYGIVGCLPAYDTSWPSIVLSIMWFPITMAFASYWAVLLVYRLYRYRREFHRLVATQNTTKSRFIRLFILSMILSLVYLTYSIYITIAVSLVATDAYSWSFVHDPMRFNTILRVPVHGQVALDKWVQVATGYVTFALFGTGVDAHNLYKKIFIAARSWSSGVGSRAKNMFWSSLSKGTNTTSTASTRDSRNGSVVTDSVAHGLYSVTTEDALIERKHHRSNSDSNPQAQASASARPSFLKQWFAAPNLTGPLLPFFNHRNVREINAHNNKTTTTTTSTPLTTFPGVQAHAWAAENASVRCASESNAVHVIREVHQAHHDRRDSGKEDKSIDTWA
ncbi:pheromone b alpha 2 receptor [Stemphylium lycopersici]|uniref:Pheromone b alpha 2 receptor n=1 Tax=Stemphylium lycopersici TaxID=183478 RepID=A0A364NB94_STELY|nr:pheromone b alpha 2 receptor [Stemphylium lycopersici]